MLKSVRIIEKLLHSCILTLLFSPFLYSSFTLASSAYRVDSIGYDISYPQCNKDYPDFPAFAIIGINGGKPFTDNPCFEHQAHWSKQNYAPLSVYQNLSYISLRSADYIVFGPNLCSPFDEACMAYNFGYQAAKYAAEKVNQAHINPRNWWLDIETMNIWSPDTQLNKAVIQGAIDYHTEQNHALGIYSTSYQWKTIAGEFKPGLPVWVAGATDRLKAPAKCTDANAFTGGKVVMVQYVKDDFDHNYLCA